MYIMCSDVGAATMNQTANRGTDTEDIFPRHSVHASLPLHWVSPVVCPHGSILPPGPLVEANQPDGLESVTEGGGRDAECSKLGAGRDQASLLSGHVTLPNFRTAACFNSAKLHLSSRHPTGLVAGSCTNRRENRRARHRLPTMDQNVSRQSFRWVSLPNAESRAHACAEGFAMKAWRYSHPNA